MNTNDLDNLSLTEHGCWWLQLLWDTGFHSHLLHDQGQDYNENNIIEYDYKIRRGVTKSHNALMLLEESGILN